MNQTRSVIGVNRFGNFVWKFFRRDLPSANTLYDQDFGSYTTEASEYWDLRGRRFGPKAVTFVDSEVANQGRENKREEF